jgi:hypothetical protein
MLDFIVQLWTAIGMFLVLLCLLWPAEAAASEEVAEGESR